MLSQDVESELKEFSDRLETMINRGYKSDPEIVNRSIIINLRIARMKMNDQLKSINPENMSDIGIIMNSIETEIGVIKKLKITDQKLEQALKILEDKLSDLYNDCEKLNSSNEEVNISSIAYRVEESNEENDNNALQTLEKLGKLAQQEYGD
jgi:hypothetical protein